jgi:hypothetical protein
MDLNQAVDHKLVDHVLHGSHQLHLFGSKTKSTEKLPVDGSLYQLLLDHSKLSDHLKLSSLGTDTVKNTGVASDVNNDLAVGISLYLYWTRRPTIPPMYEACLESAIEVFGKESKTTNS